MSAAATTSSSITLKETLGFKLITVVFSVYFIVTLTLTVSHMVLEFRKSRDELKKDLVSFVDIFAPALSHTLWNEDEEQIPPTIEGVMKVPGIIGVKIEDVDGEIVGGRGTILNKKGQATTIKLDGSREMVEDDFFGTIFFHSQKLSYQSLKITDEVGTITLYTSENVVFNKVKFGFFFIVGNSLVKTIALWIIFLWVSRKYLSRPLTNLTDATATINLKNLEEISVDTNGRNELKLLENAFNNMIRQLILDKDSLQEMMNVIEEQNQTLEKKVQARTAAIKELMDNTGQGFFFFKKDFSVGPEYSKPCQLFFGQSIEDQNALQLMYAPQDELISEHVNKQLDHPEKRLTAKESFLKQLVEPFRKTKVSDENNSETTESAKSITNNAKELLNMVFDGMSDLDILREMLPEKILIGDRIILLEYRFLSAENPEDHKIMMILTDITKEEELRAHITADEERNGMILKIALDRDGFLQLLREIKGLFNSIFTTLALPVEKIDTNELFRHLHTIKGGVATYGLKKVAERVHAIESGLEDVRSGAVAMTDKMVPKLISEAKEAEELLQKSLKELSSIISSEDAEETERFYRIKESKIKELTNFFINRFPKESEEIKKTITTFSMQPIGPLLQKYASAAENLGDRLGKPVKVTTEGKITEISLNKLENFFGTIIHLVRNCVDHGLEGPETRSMLGKPETGHLIIKANAENGTLCLSIADDGGGIDADVIKTIALKKGIIDENFANSASEKDLVKLILAPGFSTKESVSDLSGRGVGMDAVKAALDELQGTIDVNTVLDEGTTFEIRISDVA
ncbi:MAG: HAMP domain-containing protein [Proteobacteria bacterium]|nr:HAMP domain-containing protein [Pseudomonadota bacterium]